MPVEIDFAKGNGLLPVVVQDVTTGKVLMLAYMNQEALTETLRTRRACYFSRSRNCLWRKGETSGNVQQVRDVRTDCDADTLLLLVEQVGGAACHEGYESCFYRQRKDDSWEVVEERLFDPAVTYGPKDDKAG